MLDLSEKKKELRQEMRAKTGKLTPEELAWARDRIFFRLSRLTETEKLDNLLLYQAVRQELDCSRFADFWASQNRRLFLPRVADNRSDLDIYLVRDRSELKEGFRGILEPDPEKCPRGVYTDIHAVVVPGLAFDRAGNRLGQGGGHYDRLMTKLAPACLKIGVCHDRQLLDPGVIPLEAHDFRMHLICTPSEMIDVSPP